ncbi:MAG: lipopolysaccharide biosynthesis protein, partial [Eubacterium sp.]|nr:lipopolysaccharide biosynthesis protein [Eubacterium sp.]
MEQESRTRNSIRNSTVFVIASIVSIVAGYFVRVVLTHVFPEEIVGVNGLFTDIVSLLTLSEMGLEGAIAFALYEPIAHGNVEKQKSIMKMYRKFYHGVSAIIFVGGLAVMPFLHILIKDYGSVDRIYLIFFIYIANSASSYLLIYRTTLIDAHQKVNIT